MSLTRADILQRVMHCGDANDNRGITLRAGNVACQVHVEKEYALVVFAGSNDVKDWIRNFEIARFDIPGLGGVHVGRWHDWLQIRPRLFGEMVMACIPTNIPIHFAGHSQGGALAQLAATQLSGVFPRRAVGSVVTFGGHRLFDAVAAEAYKALVPFTRRFVVGWDCVPRWPKNDMGYAHAGPAVYLDKKGRVSPEQVRPSPWRPWEYLTAALDNHVVLDEYYRAVRDWAKVDLEGVV